MLFSFSEHWLIWSADHIYQLVLVINLTSITHCSNQCIIYQDAFLNLLLSSSSPELIITQHGPLQSRKFYRSPFLISTLLHLTALSGSLIRCHIPPVANQRQGALSYSPTRSVSPARPCGWRAGRFRLHNNGPTVRRSEDTGIEWGRVCKSFIFRACFRAIV